MLLEKLKSRVPTLFLSIDTGKGFDKVDWRFIIATLENYGHSENKREYITNF